MNKLDGLSASLTLLERQLEDVQKMLGVDVNDLPTPTNDPSGNEEEASIPIDGNSAAELLGRIKRLEDTELPSLRADCDSIIGAKQDLLNAYKTIGMQNRRQLMSLQVAAGVTQMPSEGPFTSLLSMMNAWDSENSTQHNENTGYHIVKSAPEAIDDKKNVVPPAVQKKKRRGIRSFEEITEQEFDKVSNIIKGRIKLNDVNKVYRVIFDVFNKGKRNIAQPLPVKELSKLGEKQGIVVTGHSGESKLSTLRSLHIIEMTPKGILLYGAKK